MYTMRQAREALGIDQKTLVVWLRRELRGGEPLEVGDLELDPLDGRLRILSDELVKRLAEAHHRELREASPATVDEMRRRIEALERALALARRPAAPAPAQEGVSSPRNTDASLESPLSASLVQSRKKPSGSVLDLELLPEGWIAYNTTFCQDHGGLDPRSLERDGFPAPHDRGKDRATWWRSRGKHPQAIRLAYDPEQHIQAARMAAQRWPEKFSQRQACDVCDAL